MAVSAVPAGYHTLTPYLTVVGVQKAIDYYTAVFGAVQGVRLDMPDGSVAHVELKIGDSFVMMGEENPDWGNKSPHTLGGTPAGCMMYVEDCDAVFAKAVEHGATVLMPVSDQFYGDRCGSVHCPFGHKWTIATHIEDLTPDQMKQRMDEWVKSMGA